jgi:hypothetical protein
MVGMNRPSGGADAVPGLWERPAYWKDHAQFGSHGPMVPWSHGPGMPLFTVRDADMLLDVWVYWVAAWSALGCLKPVDIGFDLEPRGS